jgi:hypothetical protein
MRGGVQSAASNALNGVVPATSPTTKISRNGCFVAASRALSISCGLRKLMRQGLGRRILQKIWRQEPVKVSTLREYERGDESPHHLRYLGRTAGGDYGLFRNELAFALEQQPARRVVCQRAHGPVDRGRALLFQTEAVVLKIGRLWQTAPGRPDKELRK